MIKDDVFQQVKFVSVNAGCKASQKQTLHSISAWASAVHPGWMAMFIPECDNFGQRIPPSAIHSHHTVFRHFPGPGSRPMLWMINSKYFHNVQQVLWHGRCGVLHMRVRRQADQTNLKWHDLWAVGVHLQHDNLLPQSLLQASQVVKSRAKPRHACVCVVGDFNVDQLPSLSVDPWQHEFNRDSHHRERRGILTAWAEALNLEMSLPERCEDLVPKPGSETCIWAPISHIPLGEQQGNPSLLGYAFHSNNLQISCKLRWDGVPADHALQMYECDLLANMTTPVKTKWKCRDVNACQDWLAYNVSNVTLSTVKDFNNFMRMAQDRFADVRTCRQRKSDRWPAQLQQAFAVIKNASTQQQRLQARQAAWDALNTHIAAFRLAKLEEKVSEGKAIVRSKKMYRISEILPTEIG